MVLAVSQRAEPSNMLMNLSNNEIISEHELIRLIYALAQVED